MATTTPAKKAAPAAEKVAPESAASAASRVAPFDLGALKPVKTAAPVRAGAAGREARDNSVVEGWLRDLWQTRAEGAKTTEGLSVPIPVKMFAEMKSRLNTAAAKVGCGVSIHPVKKPDLADDEMMNLTFAAKERKKRAPKKDSATAPTGADKEHRAPGVYGPRFPRPGQPRADY